jgi:micrococcal nuclease
MKTEEKSKVLGAQCIAPVQKSKVKKRGQRTQGRQRRIFFLSLPPLPPLPPLPLIALFLCFLLGCQSSPPTKGLTGKIERVVSGQTVEWIDTSKQPPVTEKVRLIGIEAPDVGQQPWGPEAKKALEQMLGQMQGEQMVFGSVVLELDSEPVDRFGRKLAHVWKDGVSIEERLVKEGYVLAVPRSPNNKYDQRLAHAQEYARLMGRGIWNPENPMRLTPAEFQRQNGS